MDVLIIFFFLNLDASYSNVQPIVRNIWYVGLCLQGGQIEACTIYVVTYSTNISFFYTTKQRLTLYSTGAMSSSPIQDLHWFCLLSSSLYVFPPALSFPTYLKHAKV